MMLIKLQYKHINLLIVSTLLFLIGTSISCSSTKSAKEKNIAYSYIVELADSLDIKYLESQLLLQKAEKINRINRTKNIYNFIIITSEEESFKILEKMKADSNVISITIEEDTLHNSQSKPVGVKKVKPITKK